MLWLLGVGRIFPNDVPAPTHRKHIARSFVRTSARRFTLTAYTAQCDGCSGITATGIDVRHRTRYEGKAIIAVDPSVIALGATVEIRFADGRTVEAVAEDTGGAIDGREIDLLVGSRSEAMRIGRDSVEVTIIERK
ncbi:MAG TPA: 3D domain-containing protein [Bacillales bacterium]|nr:3D domain-containing protein [Bacillales bacterium]